MPDVCTQRTFQDLCCKAPKLMALPGRWLFIVDGIITLPLAVAGFIFFPNLPQGGKKTWWTTEEEHLLSVKRMQAVGRAGKQPWTREKVKKILLSWQTYLLRKPISSCNLHDH